MILGVNTSFSRGQLCLLQNKSYTDEIFWEKQGSHSEHITSSFFELLKRNNLSAKDLSKIICVCGPGSFTGIRVGVNFTKAIAYSYSIPILPINSLNLLSLNCQKTDYPIISLIDAQKNSVFLSKFEWADGKRSPLCENQIFKIKSIKTLLSEPKYVCGDGLDRYINFLDKDILKNIIQLPDWKTADIKNLLSFPELLNQSLTDWKRLKPVYIKASAPEEILKPTPSQ